MEATGYYTFTRQHRKSSIYERNIGVYKFSTIIKKIFIVKRHLVSFAIPILLCTACRKHLKIVCKKKMKGRKLSLNPLFFHYVKDKRYSLQIAYHTTETTQRNYFGRLFLRIKIHCRTFAML